MKIIINLEYKIQFNNYLLKKYVRLFIFIYLNSTLY